MKRPHRLKQMRLLRRDWVGDGILTLVAGAVLVIAVFLPWANAETRGQVNYSPTLTGDINGVLQTQWGTPAIVVALVVAALGVLVALTTPRRSSWLLGVAMAACGVVAVVNAGAAAQPHRLAEPRSRPLPDDVRGRPAGPHRSRHGARGLVRGARRGRGLYSPASSRKRSTELIGTPSNSAMRNLAIIAFGSPGCRLEWSRIRPSPLSPRICSIA